MKYGMVWSAEDIVRGGNEILDSMTFKTGVINWPRLFGGRNYRVNRIDPNDFDVIHIQLAGDTIDAVFDIRKRITGNTKLVVNPDYALEYWYMYGTTPETVINCFHAADFVFGQSERSAQMLSVMMGRDIPYIPHPLDTKWLKKKAKKFKDRSAEDVVIAAHRDGSQHSPYFLTRSHRNLVTHLTGWSGGGGLNTRDVVHQYYDHVHSLLHNHDLLERIVANAYCVIDHYTHSVQGRSTMECAALGVPCFGWECVDAQRRCFPDLTSPTGNIADQMGAFDELLRHPEEMEELGKLAQKKVEFFGFNSCKNMFMEMIDDRDIAINEAAD